MLSKSMRVTLDIDDKVLAIARGIADRQGSSLARALSDLARRGYFNSASAQGQDDVGTFDVTPDSRLFTREDVYRALRD